MPDFRLTFYEHYVSKFKGTDSGSTGGSLSSFFAMSEYRYKPLLEGLGHDSAILEIGCGPGNMLEFLRRCGFTRVKGIDISAEQIELVRKRGLDAEVADAVPYLDGKHDAFDAIIAVDFIEHFRREELIALMRLVLDSLKAGGRLIVQTPNGEGLFPRQIIYGDLTHMTIFTPNSLQQLLRVTGFHQARFSETGPTPKDAIGRLRGLLWSGIRFVANTVRRIEAGKSQAIWSENMICCCRKPLP